MCTAHCLQMISWLLGNTNSKIGVNEFQILIFGNTQAAALAAVAILQLKLFCGHGSHVVSSKIPSNQGEEAGASATLCNRWCVIILSSLQLYRKGPKPLPDNGQPLPSLCSGWLWVLAASTRGSIIHHPYISRVPGIREGTYGCGHTSP